MSPSTSEDIAMRDRLRRLGGGALAADNGIGKSTAYAYLHEGIDVLAAEAPDLVAVLEEARAAGLGHLTSTVR